jgi:hypothetical protein
MKHLIITSANFPEAECHATLGHPHEVRLSDYLSSFYHALRFKGHFDSMAIIETVAITRLSFLENSGIPVYYSTFDNRYANKGVNEVLHIWDFIQQGKFQEDDVFVKLTGRYLLSNVDILGYFTPEIELVAKNDGDLYHPSSRGVHTFLYGFRKSFFRQFIARFDRASPDPIEWAIKAFAKGRKSVLLGKEKKLGVVTCLYVKETGLWRRVFC